MNWNSSFTEFSKWMEQTGQAEEARLMADDISYILIARTKSQLDNSVSAEELAHKSNKNQIA
ncbi:hypothetical protein GW626_06470 [Peribacillus muralis]|uniref:hypothetical protein n=1 Tax=Peribacillus muralis TaxID=264697 RepID=UPI001F4ED35E|nr:hypothetical protein [Peribacillus muralis]MCK1992723.1 hypothetical protein [Peribacillus muralis]MCK2013278.1 hypothetical protein [Peribacillus muralis]